MQLLRINRVYAFKQCELDSMIVIKFTIEDLVKKIIDFNSNSKIVRQYGRFHDPVFGLYTPMLLDILNFSTYQSLMNGETYFIDDLGDARIIELSHIIKAFLDNQSIDSTDVENYPVVFLARLKEIYRRQGEVLNLVNLTF